MTTRGGWIVLQLLAGLVLVLAIAWGALALWFDGPSARGLAGGLAAGFVLLSLALLALVRPFRRGLLAALVPVIAVIVWWTSIPARNDRNWYPDVARLAHATFAGNLVTIENVRNFDYRSETDYTQRWETRTYDLDKLRGFDMFLSFWGPTLIAHTIASWEFDDGQHLAISIETRKEQGEEYSAVRGFFRQYELYYVVADERDLVRLRTNYRGEQAYLYRLRVPRDAARAFLREYLREVNELAAQPRWYNALTHNCTTTIRYHAQQVGESRRLDWRLFANGRADEMLYDQGRLDTTLPFPELKARSDITSKAKAADADPEFSARIRDGLPGAHPVLDRQ